MWTGCTANENGEFHKTEERNVRVSALLDMGIATAKEEREQGER
jgi:hypothetical protein